MLAMCAWIWAVDDEHWGLGMLCVLLLLAYLDNPRIPSALWNGGGVCPWLATRKQRGTLMFQGTHRDHHQTLKVWIMWLRWKRIHLQWGRPEFDLWVRKISSRRKWLPTPVFLSWTVEAGRLQSIGSQTQTWLSNAHTHTRIIYYIWKAEWVDVSELGLDTCPLRSVWY